MEEYPANLFEFEAIFPSDEACREYLFKLRFSNGFKCPRCGCEKCWKKNFRAMGVTAVGSVAIARKALALLALPVLTNNGMIRSVDTPLGDALRCICGFNYKQSTLTKFMAELKYLGAAKYLLHSQIEFWQKFWQKHPIGKMELPVLCYYVDGNTKALWSKKRVKKSKVTMLGRVMGCMETVFVHDNFGRPIYFETYSRHAPVGEYLPESFPKDREGS